MNDAPQIATVTLPARIASSGLHYDWQSVVLVLGLIAIAYWWGVFIGRSK